VQAQMSAMLETFDALTSAPLLSLEVELVLMRGVPPQVRILKASEDAAFDDFVMRRLPETVLAVQVPLASEKQAFTSHWEITGWVKRRNPNDIAFLLGVDFSAAFQMLSKSAIYEFRPRLLKAY